MRRRASAGGLTVNAIAGSHVVFLGLDLEAANRVGFRGFAVRRTDHAEEETTWMRGMKTFQATEPHPARGETFSTRRHPIQGFQWADYSAKPGRAYTYLVAALYGEPAALEARIQLEVAVITESEGGPTHSAYFNRGSVATQEYARRFENLPPNEAGQGARNWLSRGLLEALLAFLGRAGQGWSLHGAVYELQWPAVLEAVREAHLRGAKVKILFDDVEAYAKGKPAGPWKRNREAIAAAQIKALSQGRGNGKLMHNKFFVLSENGVPKAVWTGSTNLTENGIFGHSNVGHVVEDETVARAFLEYWQRLEADPPLGNAYSSANVAASPAPPVPWDRPTTAVFCPRGSSLDALAWYADLARSAESGLFMTFAFGMQERFKEVYRQDDEVLRMALLENEGNSSRTREQDKLDIQEIRNRPNVVLALGNRIATNGFDRWLEELSRINPHVHVHWIHTKYLLADPLGEQPVVVVGSANFSKASTETNDENMLVIRGDHRIADIYFGEFMRLYNHYAFREAVKWYLEKKQNGSAAHWKPGFLATGDGWIEPYFDPADTSGKYARRRYFAGPLAGAV